MEEPQIAPVVDEQPDNLLSVLAAKRQVVSDTKETYIPVPGYDKEPPILLIRYRLLSGEELAGIAAKIKQQFRNRYERAMFAGVDTFILACSGVYVDLGDGKPEPLTVKGQVVTGFTRALAEGMQFADKIADPDNPRDVVLGIFGGNDIALAGHNYTLNRWMADTSTDVSQELFDEGNL